MIEPDLPLLHKKLRALENAVQRGRSKAYCLSKWSQFVRFRDGQRCVDCHQTEKLSAHHIFRKTIAAPAQFDPGNGITLCSECHRDCHRFFNRRPDLSLPVDAEGGEKLALMERFYCILYQDSIERGLNFECFYSLSEQVIQILKRMQGYSASTQFPGNSLQQAFTILATAEKGLRDEILNANGFSAQAEPFLPGTMRIWLK